ncbi:putative reverse transcriptase domain-containing protein [Tanacetum coccineum]
MTGDSFCVCKWDCFGDMIRGREALEWNHVDYDNDDDEEEEEESSDNDEEEEEHLALADSLLPIPDYTPSTQLLPSPTPPSLLSPLSSPLPLIPSPPLLLPLPTRRDAILEADMPPWKRTCFTALSHRFEIGESSAAAAARQIEHALTRSVDYGFIDTLDASNLTTEQRVDSTPPYRRALQRDVNVLQRQRIDDGDRLTRHIQHEHDRSSGNANSHDSGVPERTEAHYCLTQWFEKMESVFHISNCIVACQIKFATCTMLGSELTWWNSHVKTVGHDAAYGMTWKTLMKMMTDNYCPRGEIKKLEIEIWNLEVKGTDVVDKYVGGRPDMIQGSVMASKPKTIQEAIKIANDLIDQKVPTFSDKQEENKRKLDDNNSRNNNA